MVSYEPRIGEPKMSHYADDLHLSLQLVWGEKLVLKTIEVESGPNI
jgi:hypothetical protein